MDPWEYAENTFLSITRTSYKLMNILLTDHGTRLNQAVTGSIPPEDEPTPPIPPV